ncbi:hypothetical protein [Cytobacillus solani]|uniref:Uncharacterized protein n=1 Tax=Cytobacillus solani TaxID=1637975 RepID=A0A0Q3SHX5_9BACI|nr:hypothetical protein [Cytobacillus solani]KQL19092.1 hypothetical protein AN957_11185 [Cytobacillus solani]
MRKLIWSIIIYIVFYGLFSSTQLAVASFQPKIKSDEVLSIQVNRLNGGTRIFKYSDGYEEVIIDKVVKWINTSSSTEGPTELELKNTPISKLKIRMKNGVVATIEPAYNCISEKQAKKCTLADGEVIYTKNKMKVRLKSLELFDWILVGWKFESVGTPKEELFEETLYTRYFTYLDKTYSDFIMCPKIDKIERINGDTRRHFIYTSALNYSAHHGDEPYDRIHITLTDTPEKGVKINQVRIEKGISGKESRIQCRREN